MVTDGLGLDRFRRERRADLLGELEPQPRHRLAEAWRGRPFAGGGPDVDLSVQLAVT